MAMHTGKSAKMTKNTLWIQAPKSALKFIMNMIIKYTK